MATIASLGVKLGIDTATFQQGIKDIKGSVDELKNTLLELVGLDLFKDMVEKAMEYSDSIVKTAKANDVAVASVMELSKALAKNGGDAEDTSRVYSGFTQKLEGAVAGNLKVQQSFARVGVSLSDLRNLSEQDLFSKTIQGLGNMQDSAERNGLAFQLLGRALRGVDIQGLAKDLVDGKGKMDQYAQAVAQTHELSLKLKERNEEITLQFTSAFLPTLVLVYEKMTQVGGAMEKIIDTLSTGFKYFVIGIHGLGDAWTYVATTASYAGNVMGDVFSRNFEKARNDIRNFENDLALLQSRSKQFIDEVMNPPQMELKKPDQGSANRQVIDGLAKQKGAVESITQAYKNQQDLILQGLKDKESDVYLTKNQKEMNDAINKVILERDRMIGEINKKEIAAKGQTGAADIIKDLEKQKQAVYELTGEYIDLTVAQVQASQAAQNTFTNGWDKAFQQYVENGQNAAQQGQQAFAVVTSAMDSALAQFVKNGKINFKSLADTMIQQLLLIQMKAAATGIFSALGGGGLGSAFSGLFSSNLQGPTQSGGNLSSGSLGSLLPTFASGGDFAGGPMIVGENGPEIMVPQTGGTVIPNNKLADAMSGGASSGVTYNGPYIANMSAIDTQSGVQFLAKNQNAVWGAYQAAQRGMPQTR